MLSKNVCYAFVILMILQLSQAQRRITGGRNITSDKPYAIYLTRGSKSPTAYDFWLCGGALVTTWYIVTSAACVEDVEFMYAIAGYNTYVPYDQIDTDKCTKEMKKKIVLTCVPKLFDFEYDKVEKWSYIDIAVVKVESEFNFDDVRYKQLCSYQPNIIEINYYDKYEEAGTNVMALGWGHVEKWRKPDDDNDYNQEYLRYATTIVLDRNECKPYFVNFSDLDAIIEKYMICTLESGDIDDNGNPFREPKVLADSCSPVIDKLGTRQITCAEDEVHLEDQDETRRARKNMMSRILERQQRQTRREGICQNDHGGPLVAWMGGKELLIGVASVFRVTNDSHCTGPYLFTSTHSNEVFLDCVTHTDGNDKTKRRMCDRPPSEKGFDTSVRHISWRDHPDGPAENEIMKNDTIDSNTTVHPINSSKFVT